RQSDGPLRRCVACLTSACRRRRPAPSHEPSRLMAHVRRRVSVNGRGTARSMWMIEDEAHAEPQGEFESLDSALAELRRRAGMPWDAAPNVAPCTSWRTCGRRYEVVEFDTAESPWRE